jgi:hypothetical protein
VRFTSASAADAASFWTNVPPVVTWARTDLRRRSPPPLAAAAPLCADDPTRRRPDAPTTRRADDPVPTPRRARSRLAASSPRRRATPRWS